MPIITTIRGNLRPFGKRYIKPPGLDSTGGTITTAGGYRIHTFSAVGTSTFIPDFGGAVEILMVGGGGAAGNTTQGFAGGSGIVVIRYKFQ